ncbi:dihydroorotase [Anaerofustis stercorihominis]|uniref:Amidohydrolase family protein n=1 Tax=Anaerofustis stercorihominis DSM 17244 TaxID=445971 RepID=B1C954_9FIRM|nr:dihydroorotase [Anaerofustis stercorihominis]EDS72218.1 amidohydrolase family protein [Anaerofustis stercorihominis DSM 17244]MCQ4795181.1 dihydroorotase [Anaerofustis stercorihominis]
MKKLFKNGVIVDKTKTSKEDVLVVNGKIEQIGKDLKYDDAEIIDLKGQALMPAFIDMHSHFRDPGYTYKEDIETGMKASVKGGYSVVCTMANTNPICDNKEVLSYVKEKSDKVGLNKVIQISAIGKNLEDKEFVNIEENKKYTNLFSNDGRTIFSYDFMEEALKKSKEYDFHLLTHCQPEEEIIERDMKLLEKVGGNLHVCHISTKKSLELIKEAKAKGLGVTCEVGPHHLFADSLDYRVNPSFATYEDRMAVIQGIKDNKIDVLATDHAPHSIEDKEKGAPGIDNIEVAFSMYYKIFKEHCISINKLSEMISFTPAKKIGLNKGLIKEGYDADFAVVDLDYKGKIKKEEFISKSNNTPFDGYDINGKVLMTFVEGEKKYEINR